MVRGYPDSDRIGIERVLRGLGWDERFAAGQLRAVDRLSELPTAAVFVDNSGDDTLTTAGGDDTADRVRRNCERVIRRRA